MGVGPKAIVIALLALLAWQVVATVRHTDPLQSAQSRLAADNVDWPEVRRLARQALRANPLDTRALALLASAAEAEGDTPKAASLVSLAGARTLRDHHSHLWLFARRLDENDFAAALDHADVILRAHPPLKPALLPDLMTVAAAPGGRAALVKALRTAPPWRSWFLGAYARQAADPSGPTPVYAALQTGPRPPSSAELRPHLERLVEAGRFEQALIVWLGSLTPDRLANLDYLYNGSCAYPLTGLAFDWVIGRVRGADIGVTASPMGDGKALRVQFGRGRVPFSHVRKLMVLPPGSYALTGNAMAVDLGNDRGLRWRLACAEGQRQVLASTARITGTAKTAIAERFRVPASGCRAQWLLLELAARIAPEQDVDGGTVWYDALQVRRIDAQGPS